MKRPVMLVLSVILMFCGIPGYYCIAGDNEGILSDLKLLDQLESRQLTGAIGDYSKYLEYRYSESLRANSLKDDYYKTSNVADKAINAHEVLYLLGCSNRTIDDNALLFRDRIFLDYYSMRTAEVLEQYKKSGNIDIDSFIGRSKTEFDKYLSEILKNSSKRERIILLLQDKLIDRVYSDNMDKKGEYIDQVLALRLASNQDRRNQSIYELMESRVRIKLLEELADINKSALKSYLAETRVLVHNDVAGVILFSYISDIEKRSLSDYSVYLDSDKSGYKLRLPLGRLAAIYGKVTFTDGNSAVKLMSRDSIWDKIRMGAEGLEVDLREAYIDESQLPGYDAFSMLPVNDKPSDAGKLVEKNKSFEGNQTNTAVLARQITERLSALDSYFRLRSKGISNSYTTKFETGREAWLSGVNVRLSQMNEPASGMKEQDYSGFLGFIRQYVDYGRACAAAGLPESTAVLQFRDSVFQFRSVDEGALWILDMLYKLKYLQI